MSRALEPADGRDAAGRRAHASVDSSTRVLVAFPLSTIHVHEGHGAAQVAELLADVCRALADGAPPEELRTLATDAEQLARRLRRH